jgi:DNA topoisomerase-1
VACSNYPECKYTRKFAQGGSAEAETGGGEALLGTDPVSGLEVTKKSGRFGPYVQLGDGKEAKRSSIPKDTGELDLDLALKLLSLPREVGVHPETGEKITASIGRYGPYLAHNGKYARLTSTAEVFETGMNTAVVKLAEAAANGGRPARGAQAPLKILGNHPRTEAEIKLMAGRYGPYVTDGTTNATVPKSVEPAALTLEEAAQLIDARAAVAPAKKGKKQAAPKKAPAKKTVTKKAVAKKSPAKKAPAKKKAASV